MKDKIIIALDISSAKQAVELVRELHDLAGMFKVGGQLFMCGGPDVILEIIRNRGKVFLDLKFHDIPNTVMHAVLEAAKLGVNMMTIHASGGRAMMQAVSKELHEQFGTKRPLVVAVTVLTSFDTRALFEIGLERPLEEQVHRLALFAQECGIDGAVCSPREIQLVRRSVNPGFKIVTPGIRMPNQSMDDQQRIATPHDALAAGADYIVVGRAVTEDRDPRAALQRLVASI